jgi:hypothetical protein
MPAPADPAWRQLHAEFTQLPVLSDDIGSDTVGPLCQWRDADYRAILHCNFPGHWIIIHGPDPAVSYAQKDRAS